MNDNFELNADRFKLIKDMKNHEIVEEIVEYFRIDISSRDLKELREMLVKIRVDNYKQRTLREAGLKEKYMGILGTEYTEEDE